MYFKIETYAPRNWMIFFLISIVKSLSIKSILSKKILGVLSQFLKKWKFCKQSLKK